jgi:Kdo2-lipid IVA lauroyltransferase/acyltransferase
MIAFLQYVVLKGFSLCVNLLPEGFSLWLGRTLGKVAYSLDWEHRKVALENLQIAFGQEKSEKEIRSIARTTFQNLGMMAIEFLRIPKMDADRFKANLEIEGLANFERVRDNKKGMLLLLSHFGNWELMGLLTKGLGSQVMVIAKPVKKNTRVDRMITEVREASGIEVVSSQKASRKILQALSQNRMVGLLIDQRAKRSEGVMADFFGRKAPTTPALAVLGMRTGAPILPLYLLRDGNGKYRLMIKEPLELVQTGNVKDDVLANTELINRSLEEMIRRYPEQWFWVHRRWERRKSGRH